MLEMPALEWAQRPFETSQRQFCAGPLLRPRHRLISGRSVRLHRDGDFEPGMVVVEPDGNVVQVGDCAYEA